MKENPKISCVIVDHEEKAVNALKDQLLKFQEIKVLDSVTHYNEVKEIIKDYQPDIVFLEMELFREKGLEFYEEIRKQSNKPFSTIIHSSLTNWILDTNLNAEEDFALHTPAQKELSDVIEKHKSFQLDLCSSLKLSDSSSSKENIAALSTATGIQFLPKCKIGLFTYQKEEGSTRGYWYAHHIDGEVRLKGGLNSKYLLQLVGNQDFILASQSAIVNINYISSIEIKSYLCLLHPPFNEHKIKISRNCMTQIRKRFECY